ncbi:MAG: proline--tRNA ligase [Candidatus Saccharimonadales bacterium]
MRLSQLYTKTRKDIPADETAKNAQLLIQAGYIHKEMAGVYSFLPLGKQVLDNIAGVIRHEMNAIGALEVQMSVLQPQDIWIKTDRWDDKKVDNWFKTKLSNGTELGVGLTHEEAVADSLKDYIRSYKDLPVYVYQIQNKFRNELRAKSGLMRGREFYMKDLYSFSKNQEEHDQFYQMATEAYLKIYSRLGLGAITYKTFASGGIFSKYSHEFQTISSVGEDTIYVHETKRIAINKEVYTDEVLNELEINKSDLVEKKAVEVGNIFPLGSKYTDALDVYYSNENGDRTSLIMGSYGIGVSRLMGLLAEHFSDSKGLVWPEDIAPAKVIIVRLGDDVDVTAKADLIYSTLKENNISVLYDDRDVRAGEKFADADLMGIPLRIVISKKTIATDTFEIKQRTHDITQQLSLEELLKKLGC